MIRPRLAFALLAVFVVGCANEPTVPTPQVTKVAKPVGSHAASLGTYSPALNSSLDPAVTFAYQPLPLTAFAINDAGLVVGDVGSNGTSAAWTASGGLVVLGNVDGTTGCCSYLKSVNAQGVAVGATGNDPNWGIAVQVWSQSTNARTVLGPGVGFGINDNGDIVGHSDPFFIPNGGTRVQLPLGTFFIHGYIGEGRAINNTRSIVGYLWGPDGLSHAVTWPSPAGPVVDLGSLGGDQAQANSINTAGDIVGWGEVAHASTVRHAVLWPATGGMIDLNTWPNPCAGSSEARGANDQGIIVGLCNGQPVLWTALQGMRLLSLPSAPGNGQTPYAINSLLQIVGTGSLWQPAQSAQTITFGTLSGHTFGDADFAVSATASSGLAVTFSAGGSCIVSGTSVHLTGVGNCTITASQAGNASYLAAPNVTQSFTIAQATPSIAWTPPMSTFWGTPLSAVQLNATATGIGGGPLAGTFTYTPPAGTYLPAGPAQTLSVTFNPLDAVNYSPASMTAQIAVVYATPKTKDECKDGGWESVVRADGSAFKNQGDCIQYVNTGK